MKGGVALKRATPVLLALLIISSVRSATPSIHAQAPTCLSDDAHYGAITAHYSVAKPLAGKMAAALNDGVNDITLLNDAVRRSNIYALIREMMADNGTAYPI